MALAQDDAIKVGETKKYNRLFDALMAVNEELKSRPGDQRHALFRLYDYPNMQVRMMVAHSTLVLAPVEARQLLEDIRASRWYPQAGSAGMSLSALDDGIYKPT